MWAALPRESAKSADSRLAAAVAASSVCVEARSVFGQCEDGGFDVAGLGQDLVLDQRLVGHEGVERGHAAHRGIQLIE